jgi:hypothetical protein
MSALYDSFVGCDKVLQDSDSAPFGHLAKGKRTPESNVFTGVAKTS